MTSLPIELLAELVVRQVRAPKHPPASLESPRALSAAALGGPKTQPHRSSPPEPSTAESEAASTEPPQDALQTLIAELASRRLCTSTRKDGYE